MDLADVGAHVRRELEGFRDRDGRAPPPRDRARHLPRRQRGRDRRHLHRRGRHRRATATCFAKLDTGMTEVTRPSLYGAQHPIDVLADGREQAAVVFVGPCCESGDILTPAPGDPEALAPRWVPRPADRRPRRHRRRRRLLRRDVHDQLQLLPAGARGHARPRRHAHASSAAARPPSRSGRTRSKDPMRTHRGAGGRATTVGRGT